MRRSALVYLAGLAAAAVVVLAIYSGVADSGATSTATNGDVASETPGGGAAATQDGSEATDPDGAESAPGKSGTAGAAAAKSSKGKALGLEKNAPIPAYEAAPVDEAVTIENQVTASIVKIEKTESDGRGAGEIDGPALAVTVELTNNSAEAIDLSTSGVTMALGADMIPASPLPTQSKSDPFSGTLASGKKATATYVFLVREGSPAELRIEVTHGGTNPLIVFTGTRP